MMWHIICVVFCWTACPNIFILLLLYRCRFFLVKLELRTIKVIVHGDIWSEWFTCEFVVFTMRLIVPRLLSFLTFLPLNAYKCGTIPSWWIANLQFMEQSIFFTHTVPQCFLLLQLLFINLSEVRHHINGQEKNVVMVPVSFVFLTIEIVLQMYVLRSEVLNNNHSRP